MRKTSGERQREPAEAGKEKKEGSEKKVDNSKVDNFANCN